MREEILQLAWYEGVIARKRLQTEEGLDLIVINPGEWNEASGPDFTNAVIQLGEVKWVGNVEIHIKASDWRKHNHHTNNVYSEVILHVVCYNDDPVKRLSGELIPTLRIDPLDLSAKLHHYENWLKSKCELACSMDLPTTPQEVWNDWITHLSNVRYNRKASVSLEILQRTQGDVVLSEMMAVAYVCGLPINSEPLVQLAQSIPWGIVLRKYWTWEEFKKAVLYMAGFKESFHFENSHLINRVLIERDRWKYGKMRPSSFPEIRIIQWARWAYLRVIEKSVDSTTIFSNPEQVWNGEYLDRQPGSQTLQLWKINLLPMLQMILKHSNRPMLNYYWSDWKPERNKVVTQFVLAGRLIQNAEESQGAIQLHQAFCRFKKCVNCAVGRYHLRKVDND